MFEAIIPGEGWQSSQNYGNKAKNYKFIFKSLYILPVTYFCIKKLFINLFVVINHGRYCLRLFVFSLQKFTYYNSNMDD
jgi:hypothetical protein